MPFPVIIRDKASQISLLTRSRSASATELILVRLLLRVAFAVGLCSSFKQVSSWLDRFRDVVSTQQLSGTPKTAPLSSFDLSEKQEFDFFEFKTNDRRSSIFTVCLKMKIVLSVLSKKTHTHTHTVVGLFWFSFMSFSYSGVYFLWQTFSSA